MGAGGPGAASGNRMDVRARDGAPIALWVDGQGPPLVMVHGSLGDHTGFGALVETMRDEFTTFAIDRRGFGATPDSEPYTLEREFDDVADVVNAVAERSGGPVSLLGHSFGANCAMGGAARSGHVSRLVLYEPSLGLKSSMESIEAVERELAAGNREAAVVMVLAEQLEMSENDIAALRATPRWQVLLAGAPTMPRETRAETTWAYAPGCFDRIAAPTLMLAGSESPAPIIGATIAAAAAIPDAVIRVLPGHGHLAHRVEPGLVADIIRGFVFGR